MTDGRSKPETESSLSTDLFNAVRYYLRGRRGLFAIGGVLVIAAVAFNWGWLAAIGIAPLILSLLPCAVMCALGMCMMHRKPAGTDSAGNNTSPRRDIPKVEILPPEPEPVRLSEPRNDDQVIPQAPVATHDVSEKRSRKYPEGNGHG